MIENYLSNDSESYINTKYYLKDISYGNYSKWLMDYVAQPFGFNNDYDIIDAYVYGMLVTLLYNDECISFSCRTDSCAEPDKDKETNENIINSAHPDIKASVRNNKEDGDGSIEIGGICFPLEIGYTDSCTTFNHLWRSSKLVRFPYNTNEITFMVLKQGIRLVTNLSENKLAVGEG